MEGVVLIIIGAVLSRFFCSFLLNILNNNMWSVFNEIRKDLNKLTSKTRSILSCFGFIFVILVVVLFYIILDISYFEEGLVLGFLLSLKDTCFKENTMKINKE